MSPVSFPVRVAEVVDDLANDRGASSAVSSLHRRHAPLSSTAEQVRLLASVQIERGGRRVEFETLIGDALKPARLEIFQVNLGKLCNMTCRHCHVDAGPDRVDAMMSERGRRPSNRGNRAYCRAYCRFDGRGSRAASTFSRYG